MLLCLLPDCAVKNCNFVLLTGSASSRAFPDSTDGEAYMAVSAQYEMRTPTLSALRDQNPTSMEADPS